MLFVNVNGMAAARKAFEVIRMYENAEFQEKYRGHLGLVADSIKEQKRNLRKWLNNRVTLDADAVVVESRLIKQDNDGYTELVTLPAECKTDEDAVGFFRDYLLLEARPSQYDCTGQLFTSWYKVFKRNGRFMAYHRVCADV